jgi:hypothetical protein
MGPALHAARARNEIRSQLRIPVKAISVPAESDQGSERSDAGVMIVEEVIGIVKQDMGAEFSGAKRRLCGRAAVHF